MLLKMLRSVFETLENQFVSPKFIPNWGENCRAANFQNQTCRSSFKDCVQQYLSTGAAVYHGSNCTGVIVQNTIMVALESTTFRLAPAMAPQAGIDVPEGSPATSLNWRKAVSVSGLCAAALTVVIHSCVRGVL
jgi:hypothetical protein